MGEHGFGKLSLEVKVPLILIIMKAIRPANKLFKEAKKPSAASNGALHL
jgi:hypothetical protein